MAADKTSNYYQLDPKDHDELLQRNIHKEYKKAPEDTFDKVQKKDKEFATKLNIVDRVYTTRCQEAFITAKDHKGDFINNPKVKFPRKNFRNVFRLLKLKPALNSGKTYMK